MLYTPEHLFYTAGFCGLTITSDIEHNGISTGLFYIQLILNGYNTVALKTKINTRTLSCTYSLRFLHFCWKLDRRCPASNLPVCYSTRAPLKWTVSVRSGLRRTCRLLCSRRSPRRNRCNNSIVFLRRSYPVLLYIAYINHIFSRLLGLRLGSVNDIIL